MTTRICSICGYRHEGDVVPQKCPKCNADGSAFSKKSAASASETAEGSCRQWRCTVCNYLHEGNAPPQKCPLCGAGAVKFVESGSEAEKQWLHENAEKRAEKAVEKIRGEKRDAEETESAWRCSVCGYVHTGDQPPAECPVCHVDGSKFVLAGSEEDLQRQKTKVAGAEVAASKAKARKKAEEEAAARAATAPKRWRCSVCGYVHDGDEPPETCPVCHVSRDRFEALVEKPQIVVSQESELQQSRRWRCTVCQYECDGDFPPEKCPVCGAGVDAFVAVDEQGRGSDEEEVEKKSRGVWDRFCGLVVGLHLHPILAHFPNGLLPAVVLFLLGGILLSSAALKDAAWYNLMVVLAMLPLVIFTGFVEWKRSYSGALIPLFFIKIVCAIVVLIATGALVAWPYVVDEESVKSVLIAGIDLPLQWLYFGIAVVGLAAAGIAGHLGGKLVYGTKR